MHQLRSLQNLSYLKKMKLSLFRERFAEYLRKEYPLEEVNSFFTLITEAYLGMSRLQVALNPGKELTEREQERFEAALQRLVRHEPIQYILGHTEFFGLRFIVNSNVLIPRPETEELVQWILEDWSTAGEKNLKILDIGTGSGCIAISLAKNIPGSRLTAVDISQDALDTAKENAVKNEVEVTFKHVNILSVEELEHQYDIMVSNPPYVREVEKLEMQANVLQNEPELALYVRNDNPLLFYKKISFLAQKALKPEGKLYFEINQYLGAETKELMETCGFSTTLRKDIFGNIRMLKAEHRK